MAAIIFLLVTIVVAVIAQVLFDKKVHFAAASILYLSSLILFAVVLAKPIWKAMPNPPSDYRPSDIFFNN